MNRKDTYSKFVAVFFSIVIIMSIIGKMGPQEIAVENSDPLSEENRDKVTFYDNLKTSQNHGTRASSPRTVLAELITNWGCTYCPRAGFSMNELIDVYDSSQLVMIAYHQNAPSSNDPFYLYNPVDNNARISYYSTGGVPKLFIDGPPRIQVAADTASTYVKFKDIIDTELAELSNMTITLEGYLDQILMEGTINATIEVTDILPVGNLTVRFAVVEDNQYAKGPNGEVRHRYVMRDMLTDEPFPVLIPGETYNVSRTFPIDQVLNIDSISVVVFVQNDDDKDVLQAASYDFIPKDILVIDDDQSGHPLGYEDEYHDLLCKMEYAFDGWVLNERGNPTSSDLSKYKAVIWITANTSSSTLTTIDQTAISEYLDNGMGSLFLAGENVGADIGSTTFYQDYLHSTFIAGNNGENQISGINDDPISDPFFGTTIPITGSSPSEISPIDPATTVFTYSPSGDISGIKAVHDFDSKIVYFAFMYFEGTDTDSNKMILMERILNWMMDFSFMIPLYKGWNLISIPYIQTETSFDRVLESIGGDYDCLQWYNSFDSVDSWKHYHNFKPTEMNDLSDITHTIAFWVFVNSIGGTELICKGIEPTENQSIDLHIGWNLVGYPSLINREIDVALNNIDYGSEVDSIWTYNAASQKWQELRSSDFFEPGKGYWIHSKVEETWDVPL